MIGTTAKAEWCATRSYLEVWFMALIIITYRLGLSGSSYFSWAFRVIIIYRCGFGAGRFRNVSRVNVELCAP